MKKIISTVLLVSFTLVVPRLCGQEKEKSVSAEKAAQPQKVITPLRVQVVFTEFDGDKKIGSLPYSFLVSADDGGAPAAVRMTLHIPVETSSNTGVKQTEHWNLSTNLDGRAEMLDDGRFLLRLGLDKSSIYLAGVNQKPSSLGGNEISNGQPIQEDFRTQVNLLIRDGQTIQSTVATDPATGHVLKVDVTLNVIK
ncbi:MAG: hypothetical protein WA765_13020 [Candidatus Acidiferrum sp.]